MKRYTVILTNKKWYNSIESAEVSFKSPTGGVVNIQKRYFKWGLKAMRRINEIIDGEIRRVNYPIKITRGEMQTLLDMSKVKSYDGAEDWYDKLIKVTELDPAGGYGINSHI